MELRASQSLSMVEEGVTGLGAPKERPVACALLVQDCHGVDVGVGLLIAVGDDKMSVDM